MQADFDSVVRKLVEEAHLSREEILGLVEEKKKELAGLVSDIGAAHIIANELGIQTLPSLKTVSKIDDLKPGMSAVDLVARVQRVFEKKEFERKGQAGQMGQVASIILLDETGTTRLVLWGALANLSEAAKQGDILKISNAYSKTDQQGRVELHASNRTRISLNPDGVGLELPQALAAGSFGGPAKEKEISELLETEPAAVSIRAIVMKVFDQRSPFFETCSTCGRSVNLCAEHDHATTKKALILSLLLDDGTGVLRTTLFKQAAESLLKMSTEEAEKLADLAGNPLVLYTAANKVVGTELLFSGRVKKNAVFDRMEMIANSVSPVNVAAEIAKLEKELEAVAATTTTQ
jgi:replication factor A1